MSLNELSHLCLRTSRIIAYLVREDNWVLVLPGVTAFFSLAITDVDRSSESGIGSSLLFEIKWIWVISLVSSYFRWNQGQERPHRLIAKCRPPPYRIDRLGR